MKANKIIQVMFFNKKILFASAVFLLLNVKMIAQTTVADQLKDQFEQYQKNNLQEKLFVHTDKTFYLAGEQVWFKIYMVDAFFNHPLNISKVAYVEIIDKDSKPVLQTKIAIDDASGNGSLAIPMSITSGNYTLRTYTQWMKNLSADFFYEQPISIINTFGENTIPVAEKAKDTDFQFFPEGGNLVAGLTSTIAFKATDKMGDGLQCNGVVIDQKKDTVATFKSLVFGMGNFTFTPQKDKQYKAIIKLSNDTTITKDIPQIFDNGFVMNLQDVVDGNIKITVTTNSASLFNLPVYLFVHCHNVVKVVQAAQPLDGKASFIINKNILADGIAHFTLFNSDKQPVCERLYFKRPLRILHLHSETEKGSYSPREKVNVNVSATDELNEFAASDLSMSVFLVDSLQQAGYTDILSYLLLVSDLKGKIQSPSFYFDEKNTDADKAADNLMLTQGWRRFDWQTVLQNKIPYFEYLPECEGLTVTGKLVDKRNGSPIKGKEVYLSIPGKKFQFLNAESDEAGKIKFSLGKPVGSNDIIVQTDFNQDSTGAIEIDNPYSDKFTNHFISPLLISATSKNDLLLRHIGMQVENTYRTEDKIRYHSPEETDTTQFYGVPYYSFDLDAYTRFNTMEEVIREFIATVKLRKSDNGYILRVYDMKSVGYFYDNPLVLVDGTRILNFNKLVAFNPLKIKTIDVVPLKYYLGSSIYQAIVSCKTYDGNLAGYTLDSGAVVVKFDELQQQREFYNPRYENIAQKQSHIPDFRNVLYWDPNIKTNSTGKISTSFYSSDITGKFAIVIQGITKDGRPGSSLMYFNVEKPKD